MPLVGHELGGYRIESVLGRGGMSIVYRAEHLRVGNTVALKVLAPELATDDAFRSRFLKESRMAASLNHPNVIPIYDSGSIDDLLYISMRYVNGADLRRVLKTDVRLKPEVALPLIAQTGRALDAAHRAGLIHRDVKPANILIEHTSDDEPDHVYLADFGITKHALSISGLTTTGHFVGTLDYIAPEQIQGKAVDARTDIYSLGCVFYECLAGRVPFEKDVDAAVIWAHVEESPVPPSVACRGITRALDDVILRALAKDPADRYQSCRAFVSAAQEALDSTLHATVADADPAPRPRGNLAQSDDADLTRTATAWQPVRPTAARPAADTDATTPGAGGAGRSRLPPPADGGDGRTSGDDGHNRRRRPLPKATPWLVAAVAIIAAAVVLLTSRGGGSKSPTRAAAAQLRRPAASTSSKSSSTTASKQPSMSSMSGSSTVSSTSSMASSPTAVSLMRIATQANQNILSKGLLPPSTCTSEGPTILTCSQPSPAVSEVRFQTYPSLTALYSAYEKEFQVLLGSPFQQNFSNCEQDTAYGEVSWNHSSQHSRKYSVSQMESGHLNSNLAFGRVFCGFTPAGSTFHIVWTNDADRILAVATGVAHDTAWIWWHHIHHTFQSGANGMSMSG